MRLKNNIILWLLFGIYSSMYGQIETYQYKRNLLGISDTWHTIKLSDDIFKNVSSDLSDIRIYGISKEKDTIEAPYILKENQPKSFSKQVSFEIINKSTTDEGSFITLKIPSDQTINQIELFFQQDNFDKVLALEGSQNMEDWYTIVDDYRVLSLKNELTSYDFTKVKFPNSKYQYYRVFIKGNKVPEIRNARITLKETQEANYNVYFTKSVQLKQEKQYSIIDVQLQTSVPVSFIKIEDNNDFDYYRPVRIEYLKDSVLKENGWRYRYQDLTSGILNSIEENEFRFSNTITSRIRVVIDNQDNEPLRIGAIQVKGYTYELIARFTSPATYYLTYGNANASKPSYDLKYLSGKVPEEFKPLRLGVKEIIEKQNPKVVEPLFKNKIWLWTVMGVIIALLGGFTLMMMKKK